jgi:HicB family
MPEGGAAERRLTIRVPGNLADRVEAAAKARGLSLNSYATRSFGQSTATDEKVRAAEAIEAALSALESAHREPDPWESRCLAEGIGALFRGLYRLALIEAETALTPVDQRSKDGSHREGKLFSLRELRNSFAVAEAEPVRPFPQFGPIHFSEGSS